MYRSIKVTLLFALSLCLFSCTQEELPTPDNGTPDSTIVSGNTQILTKGTWVYYEYFNGYNNPNTKLGWKVGKSNSPMNLSRNWVKFNADGTYSETNENGTLDNGTWTFLNNETQLRVSNSIGEFTSDIKVLGDSLFEWHNVTDSTYGVMMHEFPKTDSSKTKTQLLTGKKWIYNQYFNNYNFASTDLIWKIGKANSATNYSKIWVQFNADGTYSETNENGTLSGGTWTFLNNETQIRIYTSVNSVFTSDIKVLNSSRFEWHNPTVGTYGEMIPSTAAVLNK